MKLVMRGLGKKEKAVQAQVRSEGLFLLTSTANKSRCSFLPAPQPALSVSRTGTVPQAEPSPGRVHLCAPAPYLLCNGCLLVSKFRLSTHGVKSHIRTFHTLFLPQSISSLYKPYYFRDLCRLLRGDRSHHLLGRGAICQHPKAADSCCTPPQQQHKVTAEGELNLRPATCRIQPVVSWTQPKVFSGS